MITARYSYRMELMLSPAIDNHHDLRRQLHLALEHFIDDSARNSKLEAERCAAQFWPTSDNMETIAAQAVTAVTQRLCSDLVSAAGVETYEEGTEILKELKHWLGWATFKERACKACAVDEVCRLPVWPSGSKEDFEHPRCGDSMSHGVGGYWDMMGRYR
jgi:hypothetical protein